MSPKRRKTTEEPEGWETLAEDSAVGKLGANPELEAALEEAAEAVDTRVRESASKGDTPGSENSDDAAAADEEILLSAEVETEFIDEEIERLRGELTEGKDQYIRLRADFDNFRRRALKERREALEYGHQNLVKDLLATVDNLERAIDHAQMSGGADLESLLQGVELVRRDLLGAMENHGVSEIEAQGKVFDPAFHEAMSQIAEPSVAPNTVIEVLQKGYQLRERLIRPSRVVLAKAPEAEETKAPEAEETKAPEAGAKRSGAAKGDSKKSDSKTGGESAS